MPRRITKRAVSATIAIISLMLSAGLAGCEKSVSSASLMVEAKQYQQKGDNKAALIQLKNAATNSPENAEVRFQLANLYNHTGDPVSAEKEIRKALALGLDSSRAAPELAASLLSQGQPQKAIEETEKVTAKGPELLATRGSAYLALAKPAKAKESFEQAIAAKAASPEALMGLARLAMIEKDLPGANGFAERATAANSHNPDVWFFKGSLLRAQGKTDDAVVAYGQAITLQPGHVSAHIERAELEIAAGKFDAAKADIDAARKTAPSAVAVIYSQALLDFKQGRFAAAQESLQKVLRTVPEHMPSILMSGAVELNLGALQQAERHLRFYVGRFPNNAYARRLLAQTLLKSSQPADAAATLAPLLDRGAQDVKLLTLAGESSLAAKDFDKAANYFARASALAPQAAELHTSLGLSKLGQGDTEKGISELELATSLEPESSDVGMALVHAEIGLKHYDKALAAVLALEKSRPTNAQVQNLKGAVYMLTSDVPNARASFEKALALQPNYFEPVLNLANLDMREKKAEMAKKRLEKFLATDKKSIAAMAAMAGIANVEGHPEQATIWLEKSANENPGALPPALQLAAQYMTVGQPQKALTLMRKVQTTNASNPDMLDLLGQIQIATRDYPGALATFSTLAKVQPQSMLPQMRLAGVHLVLKDEHHAMEDLARAVSLQPSSIVARIAQIGLLARMGKPDEAIALARQVQKLDEKSPEGYSVEGDLQSGMKRPALALPAYEKAFALSKSPQLLIKIAETMKRAGKSKEAETRLALWRQANPSDPYVPIYVAESYMASKQFKPAAELLRQVVKLNPDNSMALNNLAWTYQQDKDPRALETAERAAAISPNSPEIMDTLGWLLVEQGNLARALPLLKNAVSLAPKAPDFRYHLAVALNKSGDKLAARKELRKLLADNKSFPQLEEAKSLLKML